MGSVVSIVDDVIGTDLSGKKAVGRAIGDQESATREASTYFNPYKEAGLSALAGLQKPEIDVTKDPSYNFRLSEAMKALTAAQSARGGAVSGRAMKELSRYTSDYASQEYGKAYDREIGRLSNLAGMGYNASASLADLTTGLGQARASSRIGQQQMENQLIGQGVQGLTTAASLGLFSDSRVKTNIEPLNKSDIEEMKKHLKAYAFNYVNDSYGSGDWVGIMAQDLEKSKLGKTLVIEKNGIKTIDTNKVLSMFLATMAEA